MNFKQREKFKLVASKLGEARERLGFIIFDLLTWNIYFYDYTKEEIFQNTHVEDFTGISKIEVIPNVVTEEEYKELIQMIKEFSRVDSELIEEDKEIRTITFNSSIEDFDNEDNENISFGGIL